MSDIGVTTTFTPGVRGQTRSTWRDENSLRGLLLRLYRQNPDADDDELAGLFLAEAKGPDFSASTRCAAFVDEALQYKFDNSIASVRREARRQAAQARQPASPQGVSVPARASQAESDTQSAPVPRPRRTPTDVSSLVANIRAVVLLDLPEANGKKLGDCTAPELRALGGWRINIADRIGDDTTIARESISEDEARRICGAAGIAQG